MQKDIRTLLIFLIIAIGFLVWLQCCHCNPVPNDGKLNSASTTQHFTLNNNSQQSTPNKFKSSGLETNSNSQQQSRSSDMIKGLSRKIEDEDRARSTRESQKVTSKIVESILKNETEQKQNKKSRFFDESLSEELAGDNLSLDDSQLSNPLGEDINSDRNSLMDSDQQALDELIKEVNTGNDLIVDNPKSELYKSRSRSINSAKKYRNVSYKDSGYRYDFDDDGSPSQTSQDELNSMYDDAMVFRNNEYNTNGNFKGFNETDQTYGGANLNDFKSSGPQTQQEKIMGLYNSNEYLPNNNLLDKKLTKGFQILDNTVAVSNPNLIPVLKSIPVSSVMGSNRNQTYDIRAEPPCPKTVVSPFLNSSIMPDIYSTQRGCL
jgi:hypothetical protein